MQSAEVRRSVFAGSWYPAKASDCELEIKGFLEEGQSLTPPDRKLVAGIVPHAGWYFSGSIACNVIHCLKAGPPPDVVVGLWPPSVVVAAVVDVVVGSASGLHAATSSVSTTTNTVSSREGRCRGTPERLPRRPPNAVINPDRWHHPCRRPRARSR